MYELLALVRKHSSYNSLRSHITHVNSDVESSSYMDSKYLCILLNVKVSA